MKVAFTFDDGLKDHILYVAPALEKYGYKGVFCITTDFVGREGYMSWEEIRELKHRGHEIAAHSIDHPNLYELLKQGRLSEIERQILESKAQIENQVGSIVCYFAFPHNACNGRLFKMVKSAGMETLSPHRINLGGPPANPVEALGEELCKRADQGDNFAILMFHGIADQRAYACYPDADEKSFERRIADVKRHDGEKYEVVNYRDTKWPIHDVHFLPYRIFNRLKGILKGIIRA